MPPRLSSAMATTNDGRDGGMTMSTASSTRPASLRQEVSSSYAHRIQRVANANTDDLAVEREIVMGKGSEFISALGLLTIVASGAFRSQPTIRMSAASPGASLHLPHIL